MSEREKTVCIRMHLRNFDLLSTSATLTFEEASPFNGRLSVMKSVSSRSDERYAEMRRARRCRRQETVKSSDYAGFLREVSRT